MARGDEASASVDVLDVSDQLPFGLKATIYGLALSFVIFAGLVIFRGAFLHEHRTDAGVYFRAAWAIRNHSNPYLVPDARGWHYIYPPLFAALMAPFADPPGGISTGAGLPYAASIGVWYILSLASLLVGLHILACAIERAGPLIGGTRPKRFDTRWWALRIVPLLVCVLQIGNSLMRGQVTPLLTFFVCGLGAGIMLSKPWRTGLSLSAAITLKIYPAFLLIMLLVQRKWAALGVCLLGLALGLFVLPVALIGASETYQCYQSLYQYVLAPGLSQHTLIARPEYLDEVHGNVSSFKVVIFRLIMAGRAGAYRTIPGAFWFVHVGLSAILTCVTLFADRRLRRAARADPLSDLLLLGALTTVLLPMIPLSRDHYFPLAAPLVMALVAAFWAENAQPKIGRAGCVLFVSVAVLSLIWEVPGLQFLKQYQPIVLPELMLWSAGVIMLFRRTSGTGHGIMANQTRQAILAT